MKIDRTPFIAKPYKEARYWAEAWGFLPHEWLWMGDDKHVRGIHMPFGVVFVCGSERFSSQFMDSIRACGFTEFIDAHDLDTNYEPRSALDLIP